MAHVLCFHVISMYQLILVTVMQLHRSFQEMIYFNIIQNKFCMLRLDV